jgi:hypothetical protein
MEIHIDSRGEVMFRRIIQIQMIAMMLLMSWAISDKACSQVPAPPAECTGDTHQIGGGVLENPIIVYGPCPCIGWDLSSNGSVHHYHLRVTQELFIDGISIPPVSVCLPAKNETFPIDVYAVPLIGTSVSPLSDTTYIRWEDLPTPTPTATATPTPPTPTPTPVVCYEERTIIVEVPPLEDGTCPVAP